MSADGTFEINLSPQDDGDFAAGRMLISKTYSGGMTGSGSGQMISKRTEAGTAAYCAIEEFSGSVDGRSGGFTLIHKGFMSKDTQSLEVNVLEGSGSGDLQGISGALEIMQGADGHSYVFSYEGIG